MKTGKLIGGSSGKSWSWISRTFLAHFSFFFSFFLNYLYRQNTGTTYPCSVLSFSLRLPNSRSPPVHRFPMPPQPTRPPRPSTLSPENAQPRYPHLDPITCINVRGSIQRPAVMQEAAEDTTAIRRVHQALRLPHLPSSASILNNNLIIHTTRS